MKYIALILLLLSVSLGFAEKVLSLSDAKELLLNNNPEFLAKKNAYKSVEWETRQSFINLLPSARLQSSYNYLDPTPVPFAEENYSLNYGLTLNQPLFMGGKLWLSYRMQKDILQIAKWDLHATRLELLSRLEEAYYDYLLMKELYLISLNAVKVAEHNLKAAETRFGAGTLSRADLMQFQAELSSKQVSLLQTENNRQLSYRQLQNMLKTDDFELIVADTSEYEKLMNYYQQLTVEKRELGKQRVIGYGIKNNPVLNITEAGLNISKKAGTLAKGNFLPTVNLNASKNWTNNFSGDYNFEGSTTVVLSASIPIFPLVDNYAGVRQAYYNHRRISTEAVSTEDNIKMAIEATFYTAVSSAKSIISASISKDYAEETYRMMEERFRNGLISSLELISIEILMNTSRLNYAKSKYDFLKNRSALMYLLNIEDETKLIDIMEANN